MRFQLFSTGAFAFAIALSSPPPLGARGDGTFQAPQAVLPSISDPIGGAAGDFNGDGRLDLAEFNLTQVGITLQDPQYREVWKPLFPIPNGGIWMYSMLVADFSGDGADDIAVVDTNAVNILRSRGDGTFEKLPVEGSRRCSQAAVGDWNGDGKLDLAVTCDSPAKFLTFEGKGDGTFAFVRNHAVGSGPNAVAALDWDGDGQEDLAVGTNRPGIRPLRNVGGAFEVKAPLLLGFEGCARMLYEGEFNGDGRADLLMGCGVGLSTGDGGFTHSLEFSPEVAAVADVNGDRFQDVVVRHFYEASRLYLGGGDGTFVSSVGPRSRSPYFVVRDLDGDGVTDVALRTDAAPTVSIYWGERATALDSGTATCLGEGPDMAVVDLDRDGALDLIRPSQNRPGIQVYGDFRQVENWQSRAFSIATSNLYSTIEVGDLDGDGVDDLAGTQLAGGMALVAILETPDKIRSEQTLAVGAAPTRTLLARVDEDSSLDIVIPCSAPGHLAVCLNNGTGLFGEALLVPTVSGVKHVALADLDGDGRTDAVVISNIELGLHFGEGAGTLSSHATLRREQERRYGDAVVADLNADGLLDIAATERDRDEVHVFLGKGARAFEGPQAIPAAEEPVLLAIEDFDGDGQMDLATGNGSTVAEVFLRRAGAYDSRVYALGLVPTKLRAGDFNGDGALDLVAHNGSCATVLFGRPVLGPRERFARGDAGGDGRMDVNDPVVVLGALFLGKGSLTCEDAGDANDDGMLDLTDPVAVLQRLFMGGDPLPPPAACGEDPTADGLADCPAGC